MLTTIHVIANFLFLAFLIKLILNPREFFFNPFLRPIEYITDPLLKPIQKIFHPSQSGLDYTPLIAIIALIMFQTGAIVLLKNTNLIMASIECILGTLGLLLQFFTMCVIVMWLVPSHVSQPLTKLFWKVLEPFVKSFAFMVDSRNAKIFVAFIGILIVSIFIWHGLSSIYLHVAPEIIHSGNLLTKLNLNSHLDISRTLFSLKVILFSSSLVFLKVINIYQFFVILLIVNAILSWVDIDSRNMIVQFIYSLTEPILSPIRRLFPSFGGLDLSPLIMILIISVVGKVANQIVITIVAKAIG